MALKEVESAKATIREVIEVLRHSASEAWATRLESDLQAMTGWYATKERLYAIGELCHPKALGDVYVTGVSNERWSQLIASMHDRSAQAFNALERLPETERDSAVPKI